MSISKNNKNTLPKFDKSLVFSLTDVKGVKMTATKWKNAVRESLNNNSDIDIIRFLDNKQFPSYWSSSTANIHTTHNSSGLFVRDPMPLGKGHIVESRKVITQAAFNKLSGKEKDDIDIVVDEDGNETITLVKSKYEPIAWDGPTDDPQAATRQKVVPSAYESLCLQEETFKDKLESYCKWYLDNTVDASLKRTCIANDDMKQAITDCRPDRVEKIILAIVANHHGSIIVKSQMTEKSCGDIHYLLGLKYENHMVLDTYLELWNSCKCNIEEQGVNEGSKIAGQDFWDYMSGMSLIKSLRNSKFEDSISRARHDKLLSAPNCTYSWAVDMIRQWNDTIELAKIGNKSNKKDEVSKLKAQIAKLQSFDHGDQAKKSKKRKTEHSSGKSNSLATLKAGAEVAGMDGNVKKQYTCDHCSKVGHYEACCPLLSSEQRAASKKKFFENRSSK